MVARRPGDLLPQGPHSFFHRPHRLPRFRDLLRPALADLLQERRPRGRLPGQRHGPIEAAGEPAELLPQTCLVVSAIRLQKGLDLAREQLTRMRDLALRLVEATRPALGFRVAAQVRVLLAAQEAGERSATIGDRGRLPIDPVGRGPGAIDQLARESAARRRPDEREASSHRAEAVSESHACTPSVAPATVVREKTIVSSLG